MSEGSTAANAQEDVQQVPGKDTKPTELKPLFSWPNSHSIMRRVLVATQDNAAEKMGIELRDPGDDPIISEETAAALVPELEDTVAQAIDMYNCPDHLLSFLDEEIGEMANRVIGAMSPEEFNRLVQAASEQLQEE